MSSSSATPHTHTRTKERKKKQRGHKDFKQSHTKQKIERRNKTKESRMKRS
jgi:hypothetical protein